VRSISAAPGHVFLSSIWGYALGRQLVYKRTRVLPYFLLACLAHALLDTVFSYSLSLGHLLQAMLALVFVALLRRSLRHGVVDLSAGDAPPSSERQLFRVGSRGAFGVCLGAIVMFGWVLRASTDRYATPSSPFVEGLELLLLGGSVWAAATVLPLDVALDARGVTYQGAFYAWSEVTAVGLEEGRVMLGSAANVRVATARGTLVLGPLAGDVAVSLTSAMEERLLADVSPPAGS
jgi:hypothetical protein